MASLNRTKKNTREIHFLQCTEANHKMSKKYIKITTESSFLKHSSRCIYYTQTSAFRNLNPKFRFLENACIHGIENIAPIFPAVIMLNFSFHGRIHYKV